MGKDLELFTIEVHTSDGTGAGTDAAVHCQLTGTKGETDIFPLLPPEGNVGKLFEKGCVDIFTVLEPGIGDLTECMISHDGKGMFAGWSVDKVVVWCGDAKVYTCEWGGKVKSKKKSDGEKKPFKMTEDRGADLDGGRVCMGPILAFTGLKGSTWGVSAIIATSDLDHVGKISYQTKKSKREAKEARPHLVTSCGRYKLWRYSMRAKLGSKEARVEYTVPDGRKFFFDIPKKGALPNVVYASCNEVPHPENLKSVDDKLMMWKYFEKDAEKETFHLFPMGGDQVYSDPIWSCGKYMRQYQFDTKNDTEKNAYSWSDDLEEEAKYFYFQIYTSRWSQVPMGKMLSRIPTLMMWDDHDIFDGWGSFKAEVHDSQVYQNLFRHAKSAFFHFQLHGLLDNVIVKDPSPEGPYSMAFRVNDLAIVIPDLRTEREGIDANAQVMSPKSWEAIEAWMAQNGDAKHLFFISSVPVVYPHSGQVEHILKITEHNLLDDVLDHWSADIHRAELERLVHCLVDHSKNTNTRVTIISGDVHVGSHGTMEDSEKGVLINQLVSSGIVATPPPKIAQTGFEKFFQHKLEVGGAVLKTHRMPHGPKKSFQFCGAQNYLKITPQDGSTYHCKWTKKPHQRKLFDHGVLRDPFPEPKTFWIDIEAL